MPQITNLRLLFCASVSLNSHPTSALLPFKNLSCSSSLFRPKTQLLSFFTVTSTPFTVFSSSLRRRKSSTFRETRNRERSAEKMEGGPIEPTGSGFNKRRAEGRDKHDPKTLQLKTQKLNPINTICYLQILGTGMDTQDTSVSVLLFFDKQRIIFNAGEGFQRFCTEHKVKLSKIDHVFLTRVCSETAGGLPGLLLTLAGIGEVGISVNLWGPSDLKYLADAMRSFIPNSAMVHSHSFGPSSLSGSGPSLFTDPIVLIDDEVVKISAILLRPSYPESTPNMEEDMGTSSSVNMGSPPRIAGGVLKPSDIAVIYICELTEIKGKFDPEKAKALGLKPGPKYRELQLGNSVMSDRQNVMVHPSDVLGPSTPGPIVLLVDCPTLSHLQELLSVQSLHSYYSDSSNCDEHGFKTVNCLVHLGPSFVTMTSDYQKWMKRFGGVQHIMAGHEMKNMEIPILKASARVASRLNYLCPQLFPSSGFWSLGEINNVPSSSFAPSEDASPILSQSIPAENLLKFVLRPYANLGLSRADIPSLTTASEIINDLISEIPEIVDASKDVSQLWNCSVESNSFPTARDEPFIIEEPWMDGNACTSGTDLCKQNTDGSKENILDINSCSDVRHDSVIPSCLEHITREDMEFVLLGTGSSQPSKYRNVSSIYVNLFSKGSLLLDCGEGTLGQLKRRFGLKGADDAIKTLKFIWISHIHADHHTGLVRILAVRQQLLRDVPHEPLLVIGPSQLKRFLEAYSRLEDLDMHFLDCRNTTEDSLTAYEDSFDSNREQSLDDESDLFSELGPIDLGNLNKRDDRFGVGGVLGMAKPPNLETTLFAKGRMQSYWKRPGFPGEKSVDVTGIQMLKKVLCEAGLEALISVPVVHCLHAFGVVLKAAERTNRLGKVIDGWKLVYSGDTRPCQSLINASQGATILIHEATFEDSMVEEAVARNHSTTKEAVEVGASAGVYRVILTHFSQRYPKIPVFDEAHMQKTCIGFDMMSANVADLPLLPKVLPYLKLLFKDQMMVDDSDNLTPV